MDHPAAASYNSIMRMFSKNGKELLLVSFVLL